MARIRTIKPEFWTSEQVVECSVESRLLFIGLWNFADDGGVLPCSEKSLKMKIFPGDSYNANDIRRMLAELSDNSLIALYEVENVSYIKVCGWVHQKIDKPSFKFPQPCGEIPKSKSDFIEMHSTNDSRTIEESSPPERKGKERKGEEGKGKEGRGSTPPNPPKGGMRFKPPTLDEVRKYQRERASPVDPVAFMDFYQSKAWMVGKNKMKDWQAAFRTWERRESTTKPQETQQEVNWI